MNMLESISSYNFVEIGGYAYFSNLFYNALFKVEIKTGKTIFLGSFENEKIAETNIHFGVMISEGQVYFFPRLGRYMHVYNLSDGTIQAVEVRKKSEQFIWFEDIILNDNFVYFIPKQDNAPIKKVEWNTYKVSSIHNRLLIKGERLFKYRNSVPKAIVERYKIKYGEVVSCKQLNGGKWYFFKPIGRQMLYFTEGTNNLENVILTVVNEEELKKYLYKVKKNLFKTKIFFREFEGFRLLEFLEVLILSDRVVWNRLEAENEYNIGKTVWNTMKIC